MNWRQGRRRHSRSSHRDARRSRPDRRQTPCHRFGGHSREILRQRTCSITGTIRRVCLRAGGIAGHANGDRPTEDRFENIACRRRRRSQPGQAQVSQRKARCQWQPKTAHFWQPKTAHFWEGRLCGFDALRLVPVGREGLDGESGATGVQPLSHARRAGSGIHSVTP